MIVIDTHIWIWWVTNARSLSPQQAAAIRGAEAIGLSAISVWEVTSKASRGKLELNQPIERWLERALSSSRLQLLPLSPQVALEASRLPGELHRDPADRIIVATALVFGAELVTADARLLAYPHVTTIG